MSVGFSPFAADHAVETHDPYFLTDDDGGTLWQSLGPEDPDPKPLISRRGSTAALWALALRGAGLEGAGTPISPEPCADMRDMRGWVKVTCEESDRCREDRDLKVFSSLTDMEGTYGEPVIYTEWGDRETDRPVVRDYRWLKSDRDCEHYLAADQLHENGDVKL